MPDDSLRGIVFNEINSSDYSIIAAVFGFILTD